MMTAATNSNDKSNDDNVDDNPNNRLKIPLFFGNG
jgi:hypothetical protein